MPVGLANSATKGLQNAFVSAFIIGAASPLLKPMAERISDSEADYPSMAMDGTGYDWSLNIYKITISLGCRTIWGV